MSGSLTTEYLYNGDGVRAAQIADGLRTDYVQDIAAPLPQVLTARQGGTVNHYLSAPLKTGLRGLGLIAEQQGSSAWQYHLPDALGSVRQVTDPLAQVTLSQRFDPFGGLLASAGATRSAYGFAGEEQDPTTDQLYLRARSYNPATGRFLQQDSVIGSPNQPRTLHRYAYAFNNPVNYRDPSGHMPPIKRPITANDSEEGYNPFAGFLKNQLRVGGKPERSVNTIRQSHPTYSDPYARRQSQGHRSALCSLWGIHDVAAGVFADVEKTIRDPQAAAKRLAAQASANWSRSSAELRDPNTWTTAYWRRAWNEERGNISLTLDLIPVIGDIKGGIEGLVGYDLTGRKLSQFEQTLTMVGALVGIFTIADELVDAGKLVRHIANDADFAGDAVRAGRGLGHLDEGIDAVAASRLSRLDEFIGGGAGLRGDGLRRALAGGARSGGLNKKIRAARAWSEAGADLSDPSVRGMIRRGRGPVAGGSDALVHNTGPSNYDWPGRYDASGNPAVGPYNSRSDVTLEQLENLHLADHPLTDNYGPQWAGGLDRLFGRMSPEQVMQFRAWAKEYGTLSVVGGFGETLDGALIREMIQRRFKQTYKKAAMDTKDVLKELSPLKSIRGRSPKNSPKAAFLAELRERRALQSEFEQAVRNEYGIDFPFWRHTGPPNSNTVRAKDADIDLWFHQAQPVPKALQIQINTHFGIPLKQKVDNYNIFDNWRVKKPYGAVTFYQDGRIVRQPSPWDSFDKLSPKGQEAFRQFIQSKNLPGR